VKVAALGAVATTARLYAPTLASVGIAVGSAIDRAASVARARLGALARHDVVVVRLHGVASLANYVIQAVALTVVLVAVERIVVLRTVREAVAS
jgi:hypothetical protein